MNPCRKRASCLIPPNRKKSPRMKWMRREKNRFRPVTRRPGRVQWRTDCVGTSVTHSLGGNLRGVRNWKGTNVMIAVADFVGSATLVAVTVTD